MIDVLGHGETTGADPPLIPRVLRIAFDLDELPVLDVRQDTTGTMAARSGGPTGRSYDMSAIVFHFALCTDEMLFIQDGLHR
jgi:hypothetical protein